MLAVSSIVYFRRYNFSRPQIISFDNYFLTRTLELGKNSWQAAWQENLSDETGLQDYSAAMHALATQQWHLDGAQCRIAWCRDNILAYYRKGGQELALVFLSHYFPNRRIACYAVNPRRSSALTYNVHIILSQTYPSPDATLWWGVAKRCSTSLL